MAPGMNNKWAVAIFYLRDPRKTISIRKKLKTGQMMSTSQERQSSKGRTPDKRPWPKPEVWDLKRVPNCHTTYILQ